MRQEHRNARGDATLPQSGTIGSSWACRNRTSCRPCARQRKRPHAPGRHEPAVWLRGNRENPFSLPDGPAHTRPHPCQFHPGAAPYLNQAEADGGYSYNQTQPHQAKDKHRFDSWLDRGVLGSGGRYPQRLSTVSLQKAADLHNNKRANPKYVSASMHATTGQLRPWDPKTAQRRLSIVVIIRQGRGAGQQKTAGPKNVTLTALATARRRSAMFSFFARVRKIFSPLPRSGRGEKAERVVC